ncbi:MAG TPA: hypothetical protein VKX41_15860 [Alloacidobacterium sp.]|nr:hypothetical protein [Alloacidobacterium sp.]
MCKRTARKLAFLTLLVVLAGPADRVFAAGPGQATNSTTSSSSTVTPNGITGTDPEPIEPSIVRIILSVLGLA